MKSDTRSVNYAYPLPDSLYHNLHKQLLAPLAMKENVVLLCPPLYGKDHNVRYVLERSTERKEIVGKVYQRYLFGLVQLEYPTLEPETRWFKQLYQSLSIPSPAKPSLETLRHQLEKIVSGGKEPVFLVNILESLPDELLTRFLQLAQQIYYLAPHQSHFILIFDDKWNEQQFFQLTAPFRSLFQHIIRPPLYDDSEVYHFVRYWLKQWNHQLTNDVIHFIVKEAGGILLLAKAAVRLAVQEHARSYQDVKSIIYNHEEYIAQIKFLFSRLTPLQQSILTDIAAHKTIYALNSAELLHLTRMAVLVETGSSFFIRSLSVNRMLQGANYHPQTLMKNMLRDIALSPTEQKLLYEFLKTPQKIISREKIGTILWGKQNEEKYSDWALDQYVSRLRKKLSRTSFFDRFIIQTKKKAGFYLTTYDTP